ncbi:MAG: RDD family protein [Candidatus Melainabacteria bacterium]|nr:RDD family protein [Candidatus Melainabacteria bacterium]
MPDKQWYYALDNKQLGPVGEAELSRILSEQELPPTTLVWAEHLERWTAAGEIAQFERSVASADERSFTEAPKPWHRLLARMTDNSIYSIPYVLMAVVLFLTLNAIHPIEKETAALAIVLIVTVLAPMPYILESVLLAVAGNTPGKVLFNSRVLTQSGEKLSILQALQRTGAVWIRGGQLISCVPVVGFLGLLGLGVYQYTQLVTYGAVSWDRNQSLVYQHGRIDSARVGGLVAAAFGLFIWYGLLSFFVLMLVKDLGTAK